MFAESYADCCPPDARDLTTDIEHGCMDVYAGDGTDLIDAMQRDYTVATAVQDIVKAVNARQRRGAWNVDGVAAEFGALATRLQASVHTSVEAAVLGREAA